MSCRFLQGALKQAQLIAGEGRIVGLGSRAGVGIVRPDERHAAFQQALLEAREQARRFAHRRRCDVFSIAKAASAPAASPMFHSTGCSR